ncbi:MULTISPECIES: helix-turn-helix domain-containing protein [unclassified Mesorhizobium]|uniref:helix-turn-helix domain-containing protein n=1 Tax=unclassified Mesorhizobium TaxID=325217 RepID=UPI00167B5ED5|nr:MULTISPECIES: helix-turn-helix domain-containing protein [unclassified Mesorhizobium]
MSAPASRSWTWRHAIIKSDLPPTTRHLLLSLSCFMNDVGGGCYPTQEQLAVATGLTDRAIRKHTEIAVENGWLERRLHGFKGRRWSNYEYFAIWPDDRNDVPALPAEGPEPRSGKTGTTFLKDRNDVPTTTPSSSNTTPERARGARPPHSKKGSGKESNPMMNALDEVFGS